MQLIEIDLPKYRIETEPDHKALGKVVDAEIKKHFMGRTIVVRAISSSEHPNMSADELIEIIKETGTDRYDPKRVGDRYENIDGKQIDLFAFRRKVTPHTRLFEYVSWGFYHTHELRDPLRIDILIIYDASQLKAVTHQYEGRIDRKRDGYVFKNPDNKAKSLLGLAKIM